MTLIDILPTAHAHASSCLSFDWEQEFDFSSAEYVGQCLDELVGIQQHHFNPDKLDWMIEFSELILNDIVQTKSVLKSADERIILNYIQFVVTNIPLKAFTIKKNLGSAYNWIAYSFCDDLTDKQLKVFEIIRLDEYVSHPITQQLINPCMISQWIGDFYYICRCFSSIPDVAEEIWGWSHIISIQAMKSGCINDFSYAWTNFACWAVHNHSPKITKVVELIESIVLDVTAPDQLKCDLLICLSTSVGSYSTKKPWQWAQQARSDYSHLFIEHQLLQILINGMDWEDDTYLAQNSDSILLEVDRLTLENILHNQDNKVELIIATDRLSDIITPFLGGCIQRDEGEFLITLLRKWYSCNLENTIPWNKLILIYPNNVTSMRALIGGESIVIDSKQSEIFDSMVAELNKFLGISMSVGMSPGFVINKPESGRFGNPDEDRSNDFESKLVEFYCFDTLKTLRNCKQEQLYGIITIPSHQHPIQYLTNKYLSEVWPYAVSLEKPRPDRVLNKVCLWCGANSITEEIEFNAVNSIFTKYGIEVDYFSSDNTNLNKFKDIYQSNEYDLIWIMSHGEYDHWKPGKASIVIGNNESISLDEILKLENPINDSRRLLFLNVCDGATYTNLGGLPKLGFAPALSGSNQCVVSHLWPVNPWAAALFGALFAVNLSKREGYFEAYILTLNYIRLEKEDILNIVENEVDDNGELKERLSNQDINYKLMAHSGSAAFFQ